MNDLEKIPKKFLSGWLKALLESMEKNLDEEKRKEIFNATGSFCAQAHAAALFREIKTETNDLNELIDILNEKLKGTRWKLTDDKKLEIVYEQCYCPFINAKLHSSPIQCDCSTGWLKENLEILFNKDINVELQESVLKGANQCTFIAEI